MCPQVQEGLLALGRELPAVGTVPLAEGHTPGVPVCRHPRCCLRTCFVRTCVGMVVDLPAPWPPRSPQPASQGQPLQLCLSLQPVSRPELPPASGSSPADVVLGLQSVCTRGPGSGRQPGEGCSVGGGWFPWPAVGAPAWSLAQALTRAEQEESPDLATGLSPEVGR